jgi:cytochrome P450
MPVLGRYGNLIRFHHDPVASLLHFYRAYGQLVAFVRDDPAWLFAFGPEYLPDVLTNTAQLHINLLFYAAPPDSSLRRLTAGLLGMNGDQHRQHRRLVQPAFHKKQVETYHDAMVAITHHALDHWQPGQYYDVAQEMQRLTFRVVCRVLFGLDDSWEAEQVGSLMKRWLQLFSSMSVFLFPKDLPGTPYRRLLALSEELEASVRPLIVQRRIVDAQHGDVLNGLICARDADGTAMTDSDLIGHANLLFIAGHDTSANALTWTLFLLAQHPSAMADVLDELDGILQGNPPTIAQLSQLPLLEHVIKESLRLLPPASYGQRRSVEPFILGSYQLPKGVTIGFSPLVTHRIADLYPEPDRFVPERWATIMPSPYEYLPFGAGSHACIGAPFAMMELKTILAILLQRYRLTLVPGAKIDCQIKITLSPKFGMPMLVMPQDRQFIRSSVRGSIQSVVDLR